MNIWNVTLVRDTSTSVASVFPEVILKIQLHPESLWLRPKQESVPLQMKSSAVFLSQTGAAEFQHCAEEWNPSFYLLDRNSEESLPVCPSRGLIESLYLKGPLLPLTPTTFHPPALCMRGGAYLLLPLLHSSSSLALPPVDYLNHSLSLPACARGASSRAGPCPAPPRSPARFPASEWISDAS